MSKKTNIEFDDEELLLYMKLSAKQKLEHLEQMNQFLRKIRPAKSQRVSQQLNKEGF